LPIKNLTLGVAALLAGSALAQNHHNTHQTAAKHVVHRGETLDKIAKWTHVSKKRIVLANNLNSKKFRPGLVLYIPTTPDPGPKHYNLSTGGFAPYTVRKHDSDWRIANMFHMTPKLVRILNPSVAWDHPHPGTRIRIPMKNAFIYKLARIPVIRSRYAMVIRPETVVRSAPGSNAHRITTVDAGKHVRVLDRDDHWYMVRFEHGTEGWVRGDLLVAYEPSFAITNRHSYVEYDRGDVRVASYRSSHHSYHTRHAGGHGGYTGPLPAGDDDMLTYAEAMQGTPYRYGEASRSGTDCSGFALQVLRHEGVSLPRTAAEQSTRGQHVGGGELKPGDLVFFHTSRNGRISHVGIYIGGHKFIHASSGGGKVQVNSLDEGYYKRRFATARRVVKVKHHASASKSHDEDTAAMKDAEKEIRATDPEPGSGG